MADDILITYKGNDIGIFVAAFDAIHLFLHVLGAKIAPKKSFVFSTDRKFRQWLAQHTWAQLGTTVKVTLSFQDLGAHFSVSARAIGTTLTERIEKAIVVILRIRRLPHTYAQNAKFILSVALSVGLYGVEISHINEGTTARLTTAISNTVALKLIGNAMHWYLVLSQTSWRLSLSQYHFYAG